MSRLWDKGGSTNEAALRFTVGNDHELDAKLVEFDIQGSLAHVTSLEASGLLTQDELKRIVGAFETIREEVGKGGFTISVDQEDCHTAIEGRLTELLGDLGAKVHTGRSRNDQVVTMLRLAMRSFAADTAHALADVADQLSQLATRHRGVPLPGYTHLQRAMPSSVAAWALGYAEVLCERAEALLGMRKHLARSALGSAAGYGTPIKLDRDASAKTQGYEHTQAVTAVQLTRGLDELWLTQHMQLVGIVVSRMAADLVLYATKEFGFAKLPAELTTGSSIMPNKANPDLFELMRARGAALSGYPATIASVLGGMPGGYQRDLQLIKSSLVAAFEDAGLLLEAAKLALAGVTFDIERCKQALTPELYATAYAYQLVREGMPFRDAYKKAAASPEQWESAEHEAGADAADSVEYCERLAASIAERITRIRA